MRHGSLFSGIGGFDLAAEWMGWENVFHCEINKFCQKILKQHFPNSIGYEDITTTDFTEWKGRCDIVTGGFPCQPYSQAGKRKGKADDRHLWPQMLRAIREIQPTWIVGENVPGLLNWERGMVLAEIKADLEASGFEVFPPVILPACSKNAPHKRDRLWIIAYAGFIGSEKSKEQTMGTEQLFESGFTANTKEERFQKQDGEQTQHGSHATTKRHDGFYEWGNFPVESPVCRGNDGISNRVDRIKALGNAIVPQVAYEIFKSIEQLNRIVTVQECDAREAK